MITTLKTTSISTILISAVLQTRPPAVVPLIHDNEQASSIHDSDHVKFDYTLNVVQEIGSEVEILMDGDKALPKKAHSSLPSPYAGGAAAKLGHSGGGKKEAYRKAKG